MKRFAIAACAALAAAAMSLPAQAASMFFDFDQANSSINVTSNNPDFCIFGSCALSASLNLPFNDLTIEEGTSQFFNFATFNVGSGFGWDSDARVEAILAFTSPTAGPASTDGTANYLRLGGIFTPGAVVGSLVWDNPIQSFSTAAGDFTVQFGNLSGVTFGSTAIAPVTISVSKVAAAVPEPATWAMMLTGFFGVGAVVRRQRKQVVALQAAA